MVDSKKWEVEKHIKKGRKKSNDYKWQYADYAFFLGVQTFFRKLFFKKFQSDVFFFSFFGNISKRCKSSTKQVVLQRLPTPIQNN